jgi:hypothetical protein
MDYSKLRLDILQSLVDERGITCKNKKEEMIKYLIMDDEGKYVRETTYEKQGNLFLVGIDLKNTNHLLQMGKLVEKKDAYASKLYASFRIYYLSKQKLI